ncbi:MAG: hypothetical protein ACYTDW_03155 [Planctomycetota bacterium]
MLARIQPGVVLVLFVKQACHCLVTKDGDVVARAVVRLEYLSQVGTTAQGIGPGLVDRTAAEVAAEALGVRVVPESHRRDPAQGPLDLAKTVRPRLERDG